MGKCPDMTEKIVDLDVKHQSKQNKMFNFVMVFLKDLFEKKGSLKKACKLPSNQRVNVSKGKSN